MSACFWFVFSLLCVVAAYRLLRWFATFPLPRPEEEKPPELPPSAEAAPLHRRRPPQGSSLTRAA